jgi:kynurenine formamidase
LEHWQRVRAKTEALYGADKMDELFPDSAYQLTHNALFPQDCIHVENLVGAVGLKELHNKRITLGVFPWKFKGGEAAFCRAVAWA